MSIYNHWDVLITLHVSTWLPKTNLYELWITLVTSFGALSANMTNLFFGSAWWVPVVHFALLLAFSGFEQTLSLRWMTQQHLGVESVYLLFIRTAMQSGRWKWMMQWAPGYCRTSRAAFLFLTGSAIVNMCVSHFRNYSCTALSLCLYPKPFMQPLLGRT
jgi:hypothetical protein